MEHGTTFYFVTGGIHEALDRARDAANGMDVRIGGGPNTIQQYFRTGLIDGLHVAISPVLLGGGERLFEGIDMRTPSTYAVSTGTTTTKIVGSKAPTRVSVLVRGPTRIVPFRNGVHPTRLGSQELAHAVRCNCRQSLDATTGKSVAISKEFPVGQIRAGYSPISW
jgi:hypothetical protein